MPVVSTNSSGQITGVTDTILTTTDGKNYTDGSGNSYIYSTDNGLQLLSAPAAGTTVLGVIQKGASVVGKVQGQAVGAVAGLLSKAVNLLPGQSSSTQASAAAQTRTGPDILMVTKSGDVGLYQLSSGLYMDSNGQMFSVNSKGASDTGVNVTQLLDNSQNSVQSAPSGMSSIGNNLFIDSSNKIYTISSSGQIQSTGLYMDSNTGQFSMAGSDLVLNDSTTKVGTIVAGYPERFRQDEQFSSAG